MTKFQRYSLTATLSGLIGIPVLTWLISYHLALASEEDLQSSVQSIQVELRSNRRRDLLKSNKRDLADVRFKIYEINRNLDSDNRAQAQLLAGFKQTEAELILDQACIIRVGRECEEDLDE